jgi:hypothetical protein
MRPVCVVTSTYFQIMHAFILFNTKQMISKLAIGIDGDMRDVTHR